MASNTARFFDEDFDTLEGARNAELLLAAASIGDESEVARLLPISWPDYAIQEGQTPLMIAAGNGHARCVETMLDWHAAHHAEHGDSARMDLRCLDHAGMDALMHAVSSGDLECARLLAEHCDPYLTDASGSSALMHALMRAPRQAWTSARLPDEAGAEHAALIQLMLPISDISAMNQEGENALFLSVQYSPPEVFQAVLARCDPTALRARGDSILHLASNEYGGGYLRDDDEAAAKIAALLSDPRLDPNHANDAGNTALHVAACGMETAARLKVLLAKVDPALVNARGQTALMLSVLEGEAEQVNLLAACSDVNAVDGFGNAQIHLAAGRRNHGPLEALLASPSLDLNVRDEEGRTALFNAVASRNKMSVSAILSMPGFDPSVQDHQGQTALHAAAEGLSEEIIDTLLERIDPRAVDRNGLTPADIAAKLRPIKWRDEIVRKLSDAAFALDERSAIARAAAGRSPAAKPKARSL